MQVSQLLEVEIPPAMERQSAAHEAGWRKGMRSVSQLDADDSYDWQVCSVECKFHSTFRGTRTV
jgi:hypothetical protein